MENSCSYETNTEQREKRHQWVLKSSKFDPLLKILTKLPNRTYFGRITWSGREFFSTPLIIVIFIKFSIPLQ